MEDDDVVVFGVATLLVTLRTNVTSLLRTNGRAVTKGCERSVKRKSVKREK